MKKNFLYLTLIIVFSVSSILGLAACTKNDISGIETISPIDSISDESNLDNDSDIDSSESTNLNNWQLWGTLLGGACSIVGGALGAMLTVWITIGFEKKKQKSTYFHQYYKLLNKFKLNIQFSEENMNSEKFEEIINNFFNEFNSNADLFYYISIKYYKKKYLQFENTLSGYLNETNSRNQKQLYNLLIDTFGTEIIEIQKELKHLQ